MQGLTGSDTKALATCQCLKDWQSSRPAVALPETKSSLIQTLQVDRQSQCSASASAMVVRSTMPATPPQGAADDQARFSEVHEPQLLSCCLNIRSSYAQFSRLAKMVASALRHVSRLHHKVLQLRTNLDFEQENLKQTQMFQHESLQAFMSMAECVVRHRSVEVPYERLFEVDGRCQADYARLKAQTDRVANLQSDLSSAEFHLMTKEQRCISIVNDLLSRITSELFDFTSFDDETSTDEASSDVPSLLQKYYDRKGDIDIYNERLEELNESHQEMKETHGFLIDRGDPLDLTEDEVEQSYLDQRRKILVELVAAESDTAKFRQACVDAGIDFEARRDSSMKGFDFQGEASNTCPNFAKLVQQPTALDDVENTLKQCPTPLIHQDSQQTFIQCTNTSVSDWLASLVDGNQPSEDEGDYGKSAEAARGDGGRFRAQLHEFGMEVSHRPRSHSSCLRIWPQWEIPATERPRSYPL